MRFSEEKVAASRNFANKIWNAARFILMNIEGKDIGCALPEKLYTSDKWILNRFNSVTAAVTENHREVRARHGGQQAVRLHLGTISATGTSSLRRSA